MTEKEYEEIIATQDAVIYSLQKKIREANQKKHEAVTAFCESLCARYADFIGKKVKIEFTDKTTITGFLMKFKTATYIEKIYPCIAKVKKNGTASLSSYADYKVPSYKFISQIKIVE